MGDKKMPDKKTMEELALLIVSKTGPGDDVESITSKVIDDYYGAKQSIIKHFEDRHRAEKKQAKTAKAREEAAKTKKKEKQKLTKRTVTKATSKKK